MSLYFILPLVVGAALLFKNIAWAFKESINGEVFLVHIRKLLESGNIARAIKLCYAADTTLSNATRLYLVQGNRLREGGLDLAQEATRRHFEEHEKIFVARLALWRLDLLAVGVALIFALSGSMPIAPVFFWGGAGLAALLCLWIELKAQKTLQGLRSFGGFFVKEIALLERQQI